MLLTLLQAYGEVIWFGGRVTALTFVSFIIMVNFTLRQPNDFRSLILIFQVISSIIAAWSDIANALDDTWTSQDPAAAIGGLHSVQSALTHLNIGYIWMFSNCVTSAAFVSSVPTLGNSLI